MSIECTTSLMIWYSSLYRDEEGDVTSKDDFIETANLIVKDSKEVVEIASKVVVVCTDTQLKNVSWTFIYKECTFIG